MLREGYTHIYKHRIVPDTDAYGFVTFICVHISFVLHLMQTFFWGYISPKDIYIIPCYNLARSQNLCAYFPLVAFICIVSKLC